MAIWKTYRKLGAGMTFWQRHEVTLSSAQDQVQRAIVEALQQHRPFSRVRFA